MKSFTTSSIVVPLYLLGNVKMQRASRSGSNISISEFKSVTDIHQELSLPNLTSLLQRPEKNYQPSPLVGQGAFQVNSNTFVHSNPTLTNRADMEEASTSEINQNKGTQRKIRRNPRLDTVSLNFSQESFERLDEMVNKVVQEESATDEIGPRTSLSDTSIAIKRKRGRPIKRGKKEGSPSNFQGSLAISLPKGTAKQNDLLDSIRVMINTTVTDTLADSSADLKAEFMSLKASVKQQIGTLAEKETRHHTELKVKVETDLASLSSKLSTIDTIKKDIEINGKLQDKFDKLECIHDAYQAVQSEKMTTLETTKQIHHNLMIERVTTCNQSIASFELEFAHGMEKAEIQRIKLDNLHKNFEEMMRRIEKLEQKVNEMPTNLDIIKEEFTKKTTEMAEMMTNAAKVIENVNKQEIPEEFQKVKNTCESNTEQLHQIQHD